MEDLTKTSITQITPFTSEESVPNEISRTDDELFNMNDSTQIDKIHDSPNIQNSCTRCNKYPTSCDFYTTRACVYRSICNKCIKEINAMPRRSMKKKWCSDTIIQAMMQ